MTSAELIAAVRIRFNDDATPILASDETILSHASFAELEFVRNTLALYDVVSGSITASNPWLTLPANFFALKTVILSGAQLRPVSASELDFGYYTLTSTENTQRFANWRAATGTPKFVVVDQYPDKVRLVPIPIANATVSMEGYISPIPLSINSPVVNPQIPAFYHELLVIGTLLRLNMQTDVDLFNPRMVQIYAPQWQQGIIEAQNNLRTALRRDVRVMELPRGFSFDAGSAKNIQAPVNMQAAS